MQKSLYRKLVKSYFIPSKFFANILAGAMLLLIFSFTIDKSSKNNPPNSTTEGEKDTTKGFRSLLGNDIIANNTTVLFELNPRVSPFVNDYLKKESLNLDRLKAWGQPYF